VLAQHRLGPDAIGYIRAQLEQGRTLSQLLLALPLENGAVVTYLPTSVDPKAVHQFSTGGIASIHKTELKMIQIIAAFLAAGSNRCAVFEDALTNATDPGLRPVTAPYFTAGLDVYFYVTSRDASEPLISKALRESKSYLFLGVLTAGDRLIDGPQGHQVSVSDLEALVQQTTTMLVGAYDGEAELIWRKS
jgi:hypothetical protein